MVKTPQNKIKCQVAKSLWKNPVGYVLFYAEQLFEFLNLTKNWTKVAPKALKVVLFWAFSEHGH